MIWNGLPPIFERVADLLGLALGVGMLAGDLAADDDVRLALIAGLEEPALAVLLERSREDGAVQVLMGDDVLAGDHRLVEDRVDPLSGLRIPFKSMPRPSIVGAIPQTSGATARTPGIRRSSSPKLAGKRLKTGLGAFSRRTINPSIRLEGVAHQVAQAVREAEEPQYAQDRDR